MHARRGCCDGFEPGDHFTIDRAAAREMRDVSPLRVYEVEFIDFLGLTFRDDVGERSVIHGNHVRHVAPPRNLSQGVTP